MYDAIKIVCDVHRLAECCPAAGQKVLVCLGGEWQIAYSYLWKGHRVWLPNTGNKLLDAANTDIWMELPNEGEVCALFI